MYMYKKAMPKLYKEGKVVPSTTNEYYKMIH